MRRSLLLLGLAASLLAGCLNAGQVKTASLRQVDLATIDVPAGGALEAIADGARIAFKDVKLPFRTDITLPAGTTLVRATGHVAQGVPVFVSMSNADTHRRRCNPPYVTSWNVERTGDFSCIGMAGIDPVGAKWRVFVSGVGGVGVAPLDAPETARLVTIDFLAAPLEGPAASLDLSRLSMPTLKAGKTQETTITSFDGTALHAQLTKPEGAGAKVPTVIISSPYNFPGTKYEADVVADWVPRGYAVLAADVRGFARSGGCVEVWGLNEQKDQKALVDWVAKQEWSDGNVGFYGQSYVGTTPVEAAVQAPDALKAIIVVAPVIDSYYDWHFGGVPNGEDALSPPGYQEIGAADGFDPADPIASGQHLPSGVCDPTLTARANDPRALYDDFYKERNFSARAKDVKAAVLYTHGYEDANVKDVVGTYFFNALTSPHLGLFGHWVHQHPPRADQELLFVAWLDQYVKGRPMGFEKVAPAQVLSNDGTVRALDAWPTDTATPTPMIDIKGSVLLDSAGASGTLPVALPAPTLLHFEKRIDGAPIELAGAATMNVKATLQGAENGYLAAYLYDKGPDGTVLVTFGMVNLAHRHGHDKYESVMPGEVVQMPLGFLTTDHTFAPGHTLVLDVRGARATDWALVKPGEAAMLTLDGSQLVLPTLPHETATRAGPMLDWRP